MKLFFILFLLFSITQAIQTYEELHFSTVGDRIYVGRGSVAGCPLADLPFYLRVKITRTSPRRTNFSQSYDNRMRKMQKKPGDEKGHILASQFGGPAQLFNLMPQYAGQNRNLGAKGISLVSSWMDNEKKISDYLNQNLGSVLYVAQLYYSDWGTPCRPSAYRMIATFYNNQGHIVDFKDSGSLNNSRNPTMF